MRSGDFISKFGTSSQLKTSIDNSHGAADTLDLMLAMNFITVTSKRQKGLLQQVEELRAIIKYHNDLYYNQSKPEISDAQYDELKRRLAALEEDQRAQTSVQGALPLELSSKPASTSDNYSATYEKLVEIGDESISSQSNRANLAASIETGVGAPIDSRFPKVLHTHPMLSLENATNDAEVKRFLQKVQGKSGMTPLYCERKIDGLSFAAIYADGKLIRGLTRGNGLVGEEVTANLSQVLGFPTEVAFSGNFEIRGEVYISKSDFLLLNEARERSEEPLFANPRNAAAGSLRQLDPTVVASRKLRYCVWAAFFDDNIQTHSAAIARCRELGFEVDESACLVTTEEELALYYREVLLLRSSIDYDIDGVVYKVDSYAEQQRLGGTSKFPHWAVAHKFPSYSAVSRIICIIPQVSRRGVLTPVAELQPVNIGGVLVSRATLHNWDYIAQHDFRVDDAVEVVRAGDVIPKLTRVLLDRRPVNSAPYIFDDICPECGGVIATIKEQKATLKVCRNGQNCLAQRIAAIAHFVSQEGFNIIGLGEKQIEQLCRAGLLQDVADIFDLPFDKIATFEGWGQLSASKLEAAINRARTVPFAAFLYALGIKYMGRESANAVASHFGSLRNFIQQTLDIPREPISSDVASVSESESGNKNEFKIDLNLPSNETRERSGELTFANHRRNDHAGMTDNVSREHHALYNLEVDDYYYINSILIYASNLMHDELYRESARRVVREVNGIGVKGAEAVVDYCIAERELLSKLLKRIKVISSAAARNNPKQSLLQGCRVVFTGTLQRCSRREAEQLAAKLGATIGQSVTKNVKYLVVGQDPGQKVMEAQKYGITIVPEDEWWKITEC